MPFYRTLGTLRSFLDGLPLPAVFLPADDSLLDRVHVLDFTVESPSPSFRSTLQLGFDEDPEFVLADLPGARIVLSGDRDEDGHAVITAILELSERRSLTLPDLVLALRFDEELLRPVAPAPNLPAPTHAELRGRGTVRIDHQFRITLEGFAPFELLPAEIGRTGIVVSARGIALDLAGAPKGARMDEARLRFPEGFPAPAPDLLRMQNAFIGGGGLSGEIVADYEPVERDLFGLRFTPRRLTVLLRQNALLGCSISGDLVLPFFDESVRVEVGLDLDGNLSVRLDGGFPELEIENVLRFRLTRFGLKVGPDGLNIDLAGKLTPTVDLQGIRLPNFDVPRLDLGRGGLSIPGGWLEMPDQRSIDLHGFRLDVSKFGFGTLGAGRWLGFSGALKLVDLIPAGVSVQGFRIVWDDGEPHPMFEGVGVELTLGNGAHLKGSVALTGTKFRGSVELRIPSLRLAFTAAVVCGSDGGNHYFAAYFSGDLPAGIPIGSTGLAIFGIEGIFAIGYEPNRNVAPPAQPGHEVGETMSWYSLDHDRSWYHFPPAGVRDFEKWSPKVGGLALAAGAIIGTQADNGWVFNGHMLLLLLLPGPILMLQGEGSLLAQRTTREEGRGDFNALAVVDGRSHTLTIGLDASYRNGRGGELIDMQLGCETFFDFDDGSLWYVHFGLREPRSRRVHARLFQLFEVNAYLSLDPRAVAAGAWGGFDEHWQLGPLSLTAEAWLEVNSELTFKPVHFHGDAWLHGRLGASVFGFGFGFGLDSRISGDVFDPYRLSAAFSARVELPWPLDDIEAGVLLIWDQGGGPGPVPLPLQEVEVIHPLTGARWPLPRNKGWVSPDFDNQGFFRETPAFPALQPPPVVPPDANLALVFARPVSDLSKVGKPSRSVAPEQVGADSLSFALESLLLEREVAPGTGQWEPDPRPLFGKWQLTEKRADGPPQAKLVLHGQTPFELARPTDGSYEKWFVRDPGILCPALEPEVRVCHDFRRYEPPQRPLSPWLGSASPGLRMTWTGDAAILRHGAVSGIDRSAVFPASAAETGIGILLGQSAQSCEIYAQQPDLSDEIPFVSEIDFTHEQSPLMAGNPRVVQAVRFLIGPPWQAATEVEPGRGLVVGSRLTIELPRAAEAVLLDLRTDRPAVVRWFTAVGAMAGEDRIIGLRRGIELSASQNSISRIEIELAGGSRFRLERVTVRYRMRSPIDVEAFAVDDVLVGLGYSASGVVRIDARGIVRLVVRCAADIMIRQICFTTDPVARLGYDPLEYHHELNQEAIRWQEESDTFAPNTSYRLTVTTSARNRLGQVREFVRFRTGGPPGLPAVLSIPDVAASDKSTSGLRDLAPYVRQTTPLSVVAEGEPPRLHRPFYRGYDIRVGLRVNHLGSLYKAASSDLELFLYDPLERTFLDADGKPIVFSRFRDGERRTLHHVEESWLAMFNAAQCVISQVTQSSTKRDQTITIDDPARPLLAPHTLYEARLERREPEQAPNVPPTPSPEPMPEGKTLYRIPFVTSRYTSFFHQAHDRLDRIPIFDSAAVRAAVDAATASALAPSFRPPGEAEWRVCDAVAVAALGEAAARERATTFQVLRLATGSGVPAFLLRSPEPMDDQRVEVHFERTDWPIGVTASSGPVRMAQGELGRARPNDEIVDLLMREPDRLAGFTIETRVLPDLFTSVPDGAALFRDCFEDPATGLAEWLLFAPPGLVNGPPEWVFVAGGLRQETNASVPFGSALDWQQRGPLALSRPLPSGGVAVRVQFRPPDHGEAGIVFRWEDDDNFYRFTSSITQSRRRLVKRIGGQWTLLWTDDQPFPAGVPVQIAIAADGSRIEVEADGIPVLRVNDVQSLEGRAGLFTANAATAFFADFEVQTAARLYADHLFDESFAAGLEQWELAGEAVEPARWHVEPGGLRVEPTPARWDRMALANGPVRAIAAGGGRLFAAGAFTDLAEVSVAGIVEWNGERWQEMDGALFEDCSAVIVDGRDVYVATLLSGDVQLVKWNGMSRTWSDLGRLISGSVSSLARDGELLWAGGKFEIRFIDGSIFETAENAVGCRLTDGKFVRAIRTDDEVLALARDAWLAFGGRFTKVARARLPIFYTAAPHIARGPDPSAFPGSPPNGIVRAFAAVGNVLYAGGDFTTIGGTAASRVAVWNGSVWGALGAGVDDRVEALAADARYVYALGSFRQAGGKASPGSTRWNVSRQRWEPLGELPAGTPTSIASGDAGTFASGMSPQGGGWVVRLRPAAPDYAIAGLDSWSDYRVSVRLALPPEGMAGIAFRWRGSGEHFALVYHAETASISLERVRGGQREIIRSSPLARQHDQVVLTADCLGRRVTVFVNGREIGTAHDDALRQGRIALVAHSLSDVVFQDVRVASPVWTTIHRLSGDEELPAGTRVRVHSGGDDIVLYAPGLVHQFASRAGRWGRFRLPGSGAQIRLRGPGGALVHETAILPDTAYQPVAHLVARRADATAMLLLPAAWNGASHRLRLTYHRSREGLETFTQGQSTEPEDVVVLLPDPL